MSPLKITSTKDWKHPELAGMEIVERQLSKAKLDAFSQAVDAGDETTAHRFLADHPIVFEPVLERVGHHAMWFKNKPQIRPPLTNGKRGKIPDCLIAGKGSGGIEWFIVELKAPGARLFHNGGYFSSEANKGLNQLAEYLQYAQEKQGAIRDALEISDFVNPRGIFVIGRSQETEEDVRLEKLKAFWRSTMPNIQIISYDRLKLAAYEVANRGKLL